MSPKKKLTGEEILTKAYQAVDHQPLLDALGVGLSDDLLRLALTHRSFANEHGMLPNNERLEFLGDAVLGLSVASKLFDTYPTRAESDISKMRAGMVSRYGLADIARQLDLGKHILLGRGERMTDGHDKDSILADTTEALFGAIYREHGFEVARAVILRLFADKIDHASASNFTQDWKTALQERLAERKHQLPEYTSTSVGPDHDRWFTAHVSSGGIEIGVGEGHNKKKAEQQAAHQAFLLLGSKQCPLELR
ncbi:ribonuclease III [Corynebacterium aquilae]|uniref:Ribonuclease 3 n=1 Tax=Corynebacterium aquilae DSM 44791 TaxID=1431546 RepID=A0A1L7CGT0_9CORY|nr:ribonuclease III [Corynebacterium aquilae]APT85035.1 ribonuclease III [Corynebacterium aquilae DSM 44791]